MGLGACGSGMCVVEVCLWWNGRRPRRWAKLMNELNATGIVNQTSHQNKTESELKPKRHQSRYSLIVHPLLSRSHLNSGSRPRCKLHPRPTAVLDRHRTAKSNTARYAHNPLLMRNTYLEQTAHRKRTSPLPSRSSLQGAQSQPQTLTPPHHDTSSHPSMHARRTCPPTAHPCT